MGGWFHLPLAAAAQREVEWGGGERGGGKGSRSISFFNAFLLLCVSHSLTFH